MMSATNMSTGASPARFSRKNLASLFVRLGALAMFAVILIYFAVMARGFLTPFNLINVVEQSAILGILAFGMTVVFVGTGTDVQKGGIDLSIAANAGLCGAVFAVLMRAGYPEPMAIAATLVTGTLVGALNGFAVVKLSILPLLATLAVMNIAAGFELTLTENTVIGTSANVLTMLSMGKFLGISALAWCLLVATVVSIVVLHYSSTGVRLYAVGGHIEASRAAGINTGAYIWCSYIVSGLCAAVASIMIVSRLSASTPGTGQLLLPVLAAALLGTVFSRRFVPTAGGTILSVLFIGFLANGFQLLNVSSYWVSGVQGALILLVVAVTTFAKPSDEA
jgi:ribose transport system permease protein